MSIFIVQGTVIGLLGTLFGTLGGSLLASYLDVFVPALEHLIGVQFLPRDIYFINSLPSELRSGDVVAIASMACVLSVLATLYPSWRAACVRPAEALRYE
jgi:lipoprotein-releasing system permease protein